jgi:hypothetical protein
MLNKNLYVAMYGISSILSAATALMALLVIPKSNLHKTVRTLLYISVALLLVVCTLNVWLIFIKEDDKFYIILSSIILLALLVSIMMTITGFAVLKNARTTLGVSLIIQLLLLFGFGTKLTINLGIFGRIFKKRERLAALAAPALAPAPVQALAPPPPAQPPAPPLQTTQGLAPPLQTTQGLAQAPPLQTPTQGLPVQSSQARGQPEAPPLQPPAQAPPLQPPAQGLPVQSSQARGQPLTGTLRLPSIEGYATPSTQSTYATPCDVFSAPMVSGISKKNIDALKRLKKN